MVALVEQLQHLVGRHMRDDRNHKRVGALFLDHSRRQLLLRTTERGGGCGVCRCVCLSSSIELSAVIVAICTARTSADRIQLKLYSAVFSPRGKSPIPSSTSAVSVSIAAGSSLAAVSADRAA